MHSLTKAWYLLWGLKQPPGRADCSHSILLTSRKLKPALTDHTEDPKQGPHSPQSCWCSQHSRSPPCSQVIRGTGANATTVLNTTTRARNSPLTGAHILMGGATEAFSNRHTWMAAGCCGVAAGTSQSPRAGTSCTDWSP